MCPLASDVFSCCTSSIFISFGVLESSANTKNGDNRDPAGRRKGSPAASRKRGISRIFSFLLRSVVEVFWSNISNIRSCNALRKQRNGKGKKP